MIIDVARTAGFCFGVRNAIKAAEKAAEEEKVRNQNGTVHTYGPLIHNAQAISELEAKGVFSVDKTEDLPAGSVVVIRAHGVGRKEEEELRRQGFRVIDATCPNVKKIHQIAASFQEEPGNRFVILGDPEHPEVRGIRGWCSFDACIYRNAEEFKARPPKEKKLTVVQQTTFNRVRYEEILNLMQQMGYEIDVRQTICSATMKHQEEAMSMASEHDVMIVIGGKNSSNTQKLYELCRERCPRTFFAEKADDLENVVLGSDIRSIGITAGASTPDHVIEEVRRKLEVRR